jgi:hypothetical protein
MNPNDNDEMYYLNGPDEFVPNESTSAPVEEEDTAHKGFWQHQILKLMEKHNEEGFDMKVLLNDIDEVLKFHRQLFEVSTQEENARLRSLIEELIPIAEKGVDCLIALFKGATLLEPKSAIERAKRTIQKG